MSLRTLFERPGPLIVAHKGASEDAPENTLAAFRLAVEQGADAIELDVHLSRDGVPVVIHDHTLDRTTDGSGWVKDHTLAELQGHEAGGRFSPRFAGEAIPALADVLAWARGRVPLLIELKALPFHYPGLELAVAEVVRQHEMADHVEVFSFNLAAVQIVRAVCPGVVLGVCYLEEPADPVALAREHGALVVHPYWATIRAPLVQAAHAAGLRVGAWTVNDVASARGLAALGVDAIATDAPGRLRVGLAKGP